MKKEMIFDFGMFDAEDTRLLPETGQGDRDRGQSGAVRDGYQALAQYVSTGQLC